MCSFLTFKMGFLCTLLLTTLLGFAVSQDTSINTLEVSLQTLGTDIALGIGYVIVRRSSADTWGYVCDDDWNQNAAVTVCTELGLISDGFVPEPGMRSKYRPNLVYLPVLDQVSCPKNQTTLLACLTPEHRWGQVNCAAREAASVTCQGVPDPVLPGPEEIVTIECEYDKMVLVYPTPWTILPADAQQLLVKNEINYFTVFFNSPAVSLQQTETVIIYNRQLTLTHPSYRSRIALYRCYDLNATCTVARTAEVRRSFSPRGNLTLTGETTISMEMIIYQGRNFLKEVEKYPYRLAMGEWLNMAVVLNTTDTRLRLVVTECKAAPAPDYVIGQSYGFYEDKCLVNTEISATYPLSNNRFGFRLQSFCFDGFEDAILICEATVCLVSDESTECDRSCRPAARTGRRRRDTFSTDFADHEVFTIYSPLILIGNTTASEDQAIRDKDVENPVAGTAGTSLMTKLLPAQQTNQFFEESRRLVMTLGNAADLPESRVINLLVTLVLTAQIKLGLLCH